MRMLWIKLIGVMALSMVMGTALAIDVAGTSCKEKGCSGTDGRVGGGACTNNYCAGGSGGTGGGTCLGIQCRAGNGGTKGGSCIGDNCRAGDGGTAGGKCIGKGCQAGSGGTAGGSCIGEGCKPGPKGRAQKGETVQNMGCCIAWANTRGVLQGDDIVAACNQRLARSNNPAKCSYLVPDPGKGWKWLEVEPASSEPPAKMPDPPTSVEDIKKQRKE